LPTSNGLCLPKVFADFLIFSWAGRRFSFCWCAPSSLHSWRFGTCLELSMPGVSSSFLQIYWLFHLWPSLWAIR
jgi:hypothetical protein